MFEYARNEFIETHFVMLWSGHVHSTVQTVKEMCQVMKTLWKIRNIFYLCRLPPICFGTRGGEGGDSDNEQNRLRSSRIYSMYNGMHKWCNAVMEINMWQSDRGFQVDYILLARARGPKSFISTTTWFCFVDYYFAIKNATELRLIQNKRLLSGLARLGEHWAFKEFD